jgi:hypothetical protein
MKFKIATLIWLFFMLVGCTSKSQFSATETTLAINDGGLISQNPCGPPCFFGITAGKTTYSEFNAIINADKSIFSNCKIMDDNPNLGANHFGVNCDHSLGVGFTNQIVDNIGFFPSPDIALQNVLTMYGPPDLVETQISSSPEEPIELGMILFYDNYHMILAPQTQSGTEFPIGPDTLINNVTYFSKDSYQTIRENAAPFGTSWKGYGSYPAYGTF